jgi:hypothetical protein
MSGGDLVPLGDRTPADGWGAGVRTCLVCGRPAGADCCLECERAERDASVVRGEAPAVVSLPVEVPVSPRRAATVKHSQATTLVELAAGANLFASPEGDAYGVIEIEGHREVWPLRTRPFRTWLARSYHRVEGAAPSAQALQDALGVLEGQALYDGPTIPVHVRLAEHEGAIYLDLADEHWRVVEITAQGWRVVSDPPVRFRRPRGMGPLPAPSRGGSLDALWPFVNVASEDARRLVAAWLVAGMRPRGPYPVLILHGEQGAAKSWTARALRSLLDPNDAALRAEPRDGRDLAIAARNGWVVALDNVSSLSVWLSDAICRLATGGGFATRELYSNQEEVIFAAQRPVIINGIEEVATRGDLIDRALILYLPPVADERRRDEETLGAELDQARPLILGALLDAVSTALARVEAVRLERAPRMADFARWAIAAAPGLGGGPAEFLAAYAANRRGAVEITLEASLIADPVMEIARNGGFTGTATELLQRLEREVIDTTRARKNWPGGPHVLAGQLRRLAPSLRRVGVEIAFDVPGLRRGLQITRTGTQPSVPSVPSVRRDAQADASDASDADPPTHSGSEARGGRT